ncbi:MAG: alginate export family protein [Bacteroidota bacterium]
MKNHLFKSSARRGAVLLFICLATAATAQNTITTPTYEVFGGMRYRMELDGKFFKNDAKPLWIHLLRTTLGARARVTDDISLLVQLQDARNFGEENSTLGRGTLDGTAKNFSVRQGYMEWKNLLADSLNLKLGRMIFTTNNERLIGALDWHNVGRSYDGAVLNYGLGGGFKARAFGFRLGSDELQMTASTRQIPQSIFGLDIDIPLQEKLNLYVYRDHNSTKVDSGDYHGENVLDRYTMGVYLANHIGAFEYEAEAEYQTGSHFEVGHEHGNVSAIIAGIYAGALLDKESQFRAGAGVDYYTGDDKSTTDVNEHADHLFITIYKFYGAMDFFPTTVTPATGQRKALAVTNLGLIDPYIRLENSFFKNWKFSLVGHYFLAQQPFKNANVETRDIGAEIDLNTGYTISKNASLQCGLSGFFPGAALKESNPLVGLGTDPAYWVYTMLAVSF